MTQKRIILASGSAIRREILTNAGVSFEAIRPDVDESVIKKEAQKEGADLETIAMKLAEAKCLDVALREEGLVIGSDQIMEFEDRLYDKPSNMEEARARLLEIQGKTHSLINAVAVAENGEIIWRNLGRSKLAMRAMTENEIDAYLAEAGPEILSSVGAYQIEKLGGRLFERVDGDHFAILGLSLFPLLKLLRREGALAY